MLVELSRHSSNTSLFDHTESLFDHTESLFDYTESLFDHTESLLLPDPTAAANSPGNARARARERV